ncbi:sterol desaturase family protein [Aquimarina spinulae]|uniref:sterol desaturase family protein n=1 Tax=Aquimarina spinulae TaxID=1192023 RepID=UPI000D555D71|nr:sterol desaturase family protein [Aquimarina spinulae]
MDTLNQIVSINPNYIVIGLLVFFFSLEQLMKNPFRFTNRVGHLFQNMLFQVTLVILNIFFVTFQVYCIEWVNNNEIGVLYFIELPFWSKLFIAVALYDLTAYWIHRATHRIPLLWRFHRVHHSDTSMDSSTVFRFHPIELILVFGIGNILTAIIFGTDVLAMAVYYLILYVFFFFEHSNLKYPSWLNTTLGLVFVTPDQHRVHHQQDQFYTDSNYADIFIIWDRLFGTFKKLPLRGIKYGLKEFEEDRKQQFLFLIRSPFIKIKRNVSGQKNE